MQNVVFLTSATRRPMASNEMVDFSRLEIRSQPGARVQPSGILSVAFWKSYLVTMRPYLLYVSGITGIVGLSLAPEIPLFNTLLLSLTFFLSYGFGQALTDCFQTDTDSLSSPYRPLVRGEIQRRDVLIVSLIGLGLSGIVVVVHNVLNSVLALLTVVGLATYTYFKRKWWAGPFYNAWIVAALCLIGYLSGVGIIGAQVEWSAGTVSTLLCVFCGYANFVLTGYYKDVSADRATGYRTFPVVFGFKVSSIVSDSLALLTLVGCWSAISSEVSSVDLTAAKSLALVLAAAGSLTLVAGQVRLHSVRREDQAHRAIVPVVHAYILLLSGVAVAQKPGWVLAIVVLYFAFVVTMKRRPVKQQI